MRNFRPKTIISLCLVALANPACSQVERPVGASSAEPRALPAVVAPVPNVANAQGTETPAPAPPIAPPITPSPPPSMSQVERETELLDFSYEYPTLFERYEGIGARFATEAEELFAAHSAESAEYFIPRHNMPKATIEYSWDIRGILFPLWSLRRHVYSNTGGAHPNRSAIAILWDADEKRELRISELFPSVWDGDIRQAYCAALDEQRIERINDSGWDCPAFDELAITLENEGRAPPKLVFWASPYVAGSYVEGEYVVELAIQPEWQEAVPHKYRRALKVPHEID